MTVEYLSFSAHADAKGISKLISYCAPSNVMLVHGENAKMEFLKKKINKEFRKKTLLNFCWKDSCLGKGLCFLNFAWFKISYEFTSSRDSFQTLLVESLKIKSLIEKTVVSIHLIFLYHFNKLFPFISNILLHFFTYRRQLDVLLQFYSILSVFVLHVTEIKSHPSQSTMLLRKCIAT